MRFWKNFPDGGNGNVVRIPAYAESVPVGNGSQHAAFLVNVATKPTVDSEGLERELRRIVEPGGRVYVGNDAGETELPILERLFERCREHWEIERDVVVRTYFSGILRRRA